MTRKPLLAGNWKMNCDHVEAVGLLQKLAFTLADRKYDSNRAECAVLPPFTDLRTVQTLIDGDKLPMSYGAQDISTHDNGAYTGEVSGSMLAKLGCTYVVVGHSERRQYHLESDEVVNAKALKALSCNLTPIICVGESLEVRKSGNQVDFTTGQVKAALKNVTAAQAAQLVIAYEPIWAIGTGEVASAADAQEVCQAIRNTVAELFDAQTAAQMRVLYGGSVKPGNVVELMSKEDVDGALVGGASLDPEDFAAIVLFYTRDV